MTNRYYTGLPPSPDHLVPGSFFLRKIGGWTGRWVSGAQAFTRGGSNYTHAGLILDHGEIIEAEPGGAKIKQVEGLWDYAGEDEILISDAPIQKWVATTNFPMILGAAEEAEYTKRTEVVGKARFLEGTPYSLLDYVAITAVEFHWPIDRWLTDRVDSAGHLICSALVDRAYLWSDIHLFDDHPYRWDTSKPRVVGDVTPFDLERYVNKWHAEQMTQTALRAAEGES